MIEKFNPKMLSDFEEIQKKFQDFQDSGILDNTPTDDDPYKKDVAHVAGAVKDAYKLAFLASRTALCFVGCATFLEALDHTASIICYYSCYAYSSLLTYRAFRQAWQATSIPLKKSILSFFKKGKDEKGGDVDDIGDYGDFET